MTLSGVQVALFDLPLVQFYTLYAHTRLSRCCSISCYHANGKKGRGGSRVNIHRHKCNLDAFPDSKFILVLIRTIMENIVSGTRGKSRSFSLFSQEESEAAFKSREINAP